MLWPRLSTPDAAGDVAILACVDTRKGRRFTLAGVVYEALQEAGADEEPVSIDDDVTPRAKEIAESLNGVTVANGSVERCCRGGGDRYLRGPLERAGVFIVVATGKGPVKYRVEMPRFSGYPGLGKVAVVPVEHVRAVPREEEGGEALTTKTQRHEEEQGRGESRVQNPESRVEERPREGG